MATKINSNIVANWADASAKDAEKQLRTVTTEVEENGKRFKVTTAYNVTTKQVPRAVAERKNWKKFGASETDGVGPHVSTTFAAEEIQLQFVQREQEIEEKTDAVRQNAGTGGAHCRYCKSSDHWSHGCPYKEVYSAQEDKSEGPRAMPASTPGAYVPPNQRGDRTVGLTERRNDENTCRVTNLPEDMPDLEEQLRDMFGRIGRIERFYLARDKNTSKLRGFAFITYDSRQTTERAINELNGEKFGHLILKVEWTKPSNN